jgi:hypothetical protein
VDGGAPYVVSPTTPSLFAEKFFVTVDDQGLFYLTVPAITAAGRAGADWTAAGAGDADTAAKVPFSEVLVADADVDDSASINAALAQGLHVALSPGIFHLDAPLVVGSANQVSARCADGG